MIYFLTGNRRTPIYDTLFETIQTVPKIKSIKPIAQKLNEFSDYKKQDTDTQKPPTFNEMICVEDLHFSYDKENGVINGKDLRILEKSIGEGDEENSNLDLFSLEMFENIAYTMAKHADPQIPNEVDEWLDGFNTFSIYQVLPQLIELWGLNVKTDVEAKKNFAQLSGK